jgi:hypothetical protein
VFGAASSTVQELFSSGVNGAVRDGPLTVGYSVPSLLGTPELVAQNDPAAKIVTTPEAAPVLRNVGGRFG